MKTTADGGERCLRFGLLLMLFGGRFDSTTGGLRWARLDLGGGGPSLKLCRNGVEGGGGLPFGK